MIKAHELSGQAWNLNLPRKVVFGRGECARIPELLGQYGWQRPFIVTDRGVVSAGLLARLSEGLRVSGMEARVFADVTPEPPFECVDAVVRSIGNDCDCVIGLGGGSVLDVAKVAAALVRQQKPAMELAGVGKVKVRHTGLLLAPTTAGTGSEGTFVAIFTAPSGLKMGVVDPCLLADVVVVDPALTDSQPAAVTAAAGIDAVVHAVEAFIARVATPLAQGLALEALRYLGRSIREVCKSPSNASARNDMALGSHLAGLAFANSSCCGVHALALPLGGRFHIPHGVATGGLAAAVMHHNAPNCSEAFSELGAALGWDILKPDDFVSGIDALASDVGVRGMLRSANVPASALPELARDAVAIRRLMDPNPREITEADAMKIYKVALEGV